MLSIKFKTLGLALATGFVSINLNRPVQALTIYTDLASWQQALSSYILTTDTFDTTIPSAQSITFPSGIISANSGPITLPNQFNNNSVGIATAGLYANAVQAGVTATASNNITWTFPGQVVAFGADFLGASDNRLSLAGDFDGTGLQTLSVNALIGGQNGFLGVIGTVPFSNVIFGNPLTQVDSFSIDTAYSASVPAVPGPVPVIGVWAAFGWSRRLRRRLAVRRSQHT